VAILLAESSELTKILSLVLSAATTCILAYLAYLTSRVKDGQDDQQKDLRNTAAAQAGRQEKADEKLDATLRAVKGVHSLVDGGLHKALAELVRLTREKAELTGAPEDAAAADTARAALEEHDRKEQEAQKEGAP
jgi:hypothetical protein